MPGPSSDTSTARAPERAAPDRKRKRETARRPAQEVEAAPSALRAPGGAEAGLAPVAGPETDSVAIVSAPSPIGRAAPAAVAAGSDRRAGVGLLFLLALVLLGAALALAPARALAAISPRLPEHRQDLGLALVLAMALGAGVFLVLVAA